MERLGPCPLPIFFWHSDDLVFINCKYSELWHGAVVTEWMEKSASLWGFQYSVICDPEWDARVGGMKDIFPSQVTMGAWIWHTGPEQCTRRNTREGHRTLSWIFVLSAAWAYNYFRRLEFCKYAVPWPVDSILATEIKKCILDDQWEWERMCSQSPVRRVKSEKGLEEGRGELKFYPTFPDSCLHRIQNPETRHSKKTCKEVYYNMHTQTIGWRDGGRVGREREREPVILDSSFCEQTLIEGRITSVLGRGREFQGWVGSFCGIGPALLSIPVCGLLLVT